MKKGKYHWYPDNGPSGRTKGYPKTACGLDGSDVGGLITAFFSKETGNNCKLCQRKFKEQKL